MSPAVYYFLHVFSGFLLVALTFQVFASARPEKKSGTMMRTGVLSIIMLVAGFGLLAKLELGFPIWIVVKLVCWLGLSALAGVAYRRPKTADGLSLLATLLVAVAVAMVYFKPGA